MRGYPKSSNLVIDCKYFGVKPGDEEE